MQPALVALVYGSALVLALALLYLFHARWYWHVLSILGAVAVGIAPPLESWWPPDLAIGFVFVFLLTWGIGAPLFHSHHRHPGPSTPRHV